MTYNWPFWTVLLVGTVQLWRQRKTKGKTPEYYVGIVSLGVALACAITLAFIR